MPLLVLLLAPAVSLAARQEDGRELCYGCHSEVKALKEGSKHARLGCTSCHGGLKEHLASYEKKPTTNLDLALCGGCHRQQLESFYTVRYEVPWKKEKGVPTGRSPMQDKLLAPHGFTKEHNEPRGHAFMVIDQFQVDRFQSGRFQFKDGIWGMDKTGKTWDVLTDTGQELPETAKAGNPTCIQCKTSDHILTWKYMGDKDPQARWDRGSNVVDIAKATNNPLGCIHCHDPHGAQPRVVRDALIEAAGREGGSPLARKAGEKLKVVDFRGFRKIGIMAKADSNLMCAQCHVEYNCNPGYRFSDNGKVGVEDRRTNHFPLQGPKEILAHYKNLDFYDFRHAVTGARLVKLQHPEAETYSGSVHDRAGVQCADCHMVKVKGKDGKSFTNHAVVKPINHVKEACLPCHPKSTVEQKRWMIETTQNYIKGKMRTAEAGLSKLIDTYAAAKKAGVDESILAQAREKHEEAHVLWEWWTAENSDGWHNPQLARDSLTASIATSRAGVELLTKAMEEKGK
ncbi:MAG TPA: ammonia-forming cytochrome c nitrite reductase subunit c552 [Geobacterales bacterium]|nr:ammonia-forming cytochrome c nitrite reductase subunit c552 [Geobacterales bacterium]